MKSYRTLHQAEAIAAFRSLANIHRIEPEYTDTSLTALNIITADGTLRVALNNYSIQVLAPKMLKRYRATLTDNQSILPAISQDFDTDTKRTEFVTACEGSVDFGRFAIALSEFEVEA